MSAQLNHTIVWCTDRHRSADFLAQILGLSTRPFHHFQVVDLSNGVSMDFMEHPGPIGAQHYAFLVDDAEFDAGLSLIQARRLDYWADPQRTMKGSINHHFGGRGVYFLDPDGHVLELFTKPYE